MAVRQCVYCPVPWKLFKGNCVMIKTHAEPLSWEDARGECAKNGADLLDVQSEHYFEYMDRLTVTYKYSGPFFVSKCDSINEKKRLFLVFFCFKNRSVYAQQAQALISLR
jgi:hypothetical protein